MECAPKVKKFNFHFFLPLKKIRAIFKIALIFLIPAFYLIIIYTTLYPSLPSEKQPILFYSNQSGSDFKRILFRAIDAAKNSITLKAYGVTDRDLFTHLQGKKNVSIEVIYDAKASSSLASLKKQGIKTVPVKRSGLMHQKIFTIDQEFSLIGSVNLTKPSLQMHDNLLVGIYSPALAKFLENPTSSYSSFSIGGQPLEVQLLPDPKGIPRILSLIESAKKTIRVAMFTFTHPQLVEALIDAQKRGVRVEVTLDRSSSFGSSKKARLALEEHNIPLFLSKGMQLLHHKWALIDNHVFIFGSANWTKGAFTRNEDCFLILHDLTKKQQKNINKMWAS